MKRKEILNEILARLISIDEKLGSVIHQPIEDGEIQLLNESLMDVNPPTSEEGEIEDISDSTWSR
jgi:hypothetical protein